MKHIMMTLAAAVVAVTALAAGPAPYPAAIDSQASTVPALQAYRGAERTFRVSFYDKNPRHTDLTGFYPYMGWATNPSSAGCITAAYSIVSTTNGIVDFTFSPADLQASTGVYWYEVGVIDGPTPYKQGRLEILPSFFSSTTATSAIPPVLNFGLYSLVGAPWLLHSIWDSSVASHITWSDYTNWYSGGVTAVAWSIVSGTPTTYQGYGITNIPTNFATAAQGLKADNAVTGVVLDASWGYANHVLTVNTNPATGGSGIDSTGRVGIGVAGSLASNAYDAVLVVSGRVNGVKAIADYGVLLASNAFNMVVSNVTVSVPSYTALSGTYYWSVDTNAVLSGLESPEIWWVGHDYYGQMLGRYAGSWYLGGNPDFRWIGSGDPFTGSGYWTNYGPNSAVGVTCAVVHIYDLYGSASIVQSNLNAETNRAQLAESALSGILSTVTVYNATTISTNTAYLAGVVSTVTVYNANAIISLSNQVGSATGTVMTALSARLGGNGVSGTNNIGTIITNGLVSAIGSGTPWTGLNYATNAGGAASGYFAMSNGIWQTIPVGGGGGGSSGMATWTNVQNAGNFALSNLTVIAAGAPWVIAATNSAGSVTQINFTVLGTNIFMRPY